VPGELAAGATVAGFRLQRVIGRGERSVVYEATQSGLDRRVALKLLAADSALEVRFRRLQWPEHRNVVPLYAAGAWEHGQYLAMQLVPGPALSDAGRLTPARRLDILTQVAAALDAAHAAGIVHGSVTARDVLLGGDGRALLSDFGLGAADATAQSDLAAFATLVREWLGDTAGSARGRRRARAPVLAVVAATALAGAIVLVSSGSKQPQRAPAALHGTQILGAALTPTGVQSRGCDGALPSPASPQCTLLQTRLPGRLVAASRTGAIRRWAVRGAQGELALQVLRPRGAAFEAIARTPYVRVADSGLHAFAANLAIRAGDIAGLQLAPGATIGVRKAQGAATARSFGPLTFAARPVQRSGFADEVQLRVEYVPGARAHTPGLLSGRAAAQAPVGRALDARVVETAPGEVRTVTLVRSGERIAVDLRDARRRLLRLPVGGADPRGRLLAFDTLGEPTVRLRWRNPDGAAVSHDYAIGSLSIVPSG
jgi:hypothetical protein